MPLHYTAAHYTTYTTVQPTCFNANTLGYTTLNLRHPEDHEISSDLAPFWNQLDMPALRAQAKRHLDQDIAAGIFDSWAQVPFLIRK